MRAESPITAFTEGLCWVHLKKLNPSKLGLEENETAEIIADRIHRCRIVWITSANSGYSVSNQNPVGRDSEGQRIVGKLMMGPCALIGQGNRKGGATVCPAVSRGARTGDCYR
jgi:hypothetical protein